MIKENNASNEAEVISAWRRWSRGRGAAGFHLTEVLITDGRSRVGWILLPKEGLMKGKKKKEGVEQGGIQVEKQLEN